MKKTKSKILQRITSYILVSLMAFVNLSLAPSVSALVSGGGGSPTSSGVMIFSQTASNGDMLSIPIVASFVNIRGIQFNLHYDSALLEYQGVSGCSSNYIDCSGDINYLIDGEVDVLWYDTTMNNPLSLNNNNLLTLKFKVKTTNTEITSLTFSDSIVVDTNDSDVTGTVPFNNGTISLNPDTTPPTGTILINGGSTITNNKNVILTLSATDDISGVSEMQFSNGGAYSALEPYSTTKNWTLSSSDGSKTVRVKFKDQAGNVTVTGIPATITLDTTAPIITLNGVTPDIEVGGNYTELGATTDDGSAVIATGSVDVNTVGNYTITYAATDIAGNVATPITRTVKVVTPIPSTKDITSFNFSEGAGVITGTNIAVTVPFGTVITTLVPSITITGVSVNPASGVTQNFTNPVQYTVTAANGSTQIYTVTVTIAPNTAANILSFNSTAPVANGVINGNNITLTVPFGTSLTDLPIAITLSTGATVLPVVGNTTFVDGVATNYTVTAQDAVTTQNYSVTVNVAANTAKDITSFEFRDLNNVAYGEDGNNIIINVPFGTDVTALTPTIVITGASVCPDSNVSQDFSSPVTYTVTAADGSTQDYLVKVIVNDPSDLTMLSSAIITAQNKYDAAVDGNLPGQYPAPLKANLQTAINTASAITPAFPQSVVDASVVTLNTAVTTFESGIVPPDIIAPVITLNKDEGGFITIDLVVGDTYNDPGATAFDAVDGSVAVVATGLVDTNTIGDYTITYTATDAAGNISTANRIVHVWAAAVTLTGITITAPATKLSYTVGDTLDIAGLVVTGSYSDASTKPETITTFNITGFNSSVPVTGQVLTITIDGKTTTYTINVVAAPVPVVVPVVEPIVIHNSGGGGGYVPQQFAIPAGTTLQATAGAVRTSQNKITLTLNGGANAVRMAISNTADFSGISQEPYLTTKDWALSEGNEAKTVYVKFYDANGTASPVLTFSVPGLSVAASTPSSVQASIAKVLGEKITKLDGLIATLKPNRRNAQVKDLQAELKKLGFFPKFWNTTTYYGPVTKAGVAKYQASK